MGRKKKNEQDKKQNVSVSLNPDILELLEKYSKTSNQNKSEIIEEILKKYFTKK